MSSQRKTANILDRPLSKGKSEVNISTFAFLFSELVHYARTRVKQQTNNELHDKLADFGKHVGSRLVDVLFLRERSYKRETKLLNVLLFIKSNLWKSLFGKEADGLEKDNEEDNIYYVTEKEPLVNKFVSLNTDHAKETYNVNCAAFISGIIEEVLNCCNFPAKVTSHWHQGTAFRIIFEKSMIKKDKLLEAK
ncbi:DgyrCDS13479 [Dimorphilus gyrociliatus]|uniref:Trafficking protein particle complex subunit 5 n=1 Tax=Dimorphilus gyrociliatus TaxID=2664684 RepID=A0A7I8WAS9_9ANNE|nr:DgyrCDS13479 [Dimorphilus gyrociliatus]